MKAFLDYYKIKFLIRFALCLVWNFAIFVLRYCSFFRSVSVQEECDVYAYDMEETINRT